MNEWRVIQLCDLVEFRKGIRVEVFDNERPGTAPYLGASAIEGRATQFAIVNGAVSAGTDDLLMLWDGERSGLVGGGLEGVVGSTVSRLRVSGLVTPSFLRHVLQSRFSWIQARRTGTGIPHVPKDIGSWLQIDLPSPLEQRKITEVLDTADEEIRSTERLIAKLEQVKQGLLHDLLTRGIDESGHLRDPLQHPEEFRSSALGLIPKSWHVAPSGELCNEILVGIVVKPAQYYVAEGVPILRSANVREDGIDMSDLKFMSQQDHKMLSKTSVRPGDVLTVRTGYPGTSAVITEAVGEANCVDVIISRPNCEVVPDFFVLWVNSPFGKGQVLTGQGGLAQQHFNIGQMKRLLVAVPSLREQRIITEIASSWRASAHAEAKRLEKFRLLKKGLMDDLLTGRVRVGASG